MNATRPESRLPGPDRRLRRIVSGGQTGVDRAALDVAIQLAIEHGGWCPRGRLAEDGTIPPRYALMQTRSAEYRERTERNVIDSSATLILHRGPLRGGTLLTRRLAQQHERPCLLVDLAREGDVAGDVKPDVAPDVAPDVLVATWAERNAVEVLNVAGPRESSSPGIYAEARLFLERCLAELAGR